MSSRSWYGHSASALVMGLLALFSLVSLASAKVLVDGARSHTIGAHLRIVHYRWLIGNSASAAHELIALGPTLVEAGLRWQTAELLFLASAGERLLGQPGRAEATCRAALEAMAFGRFDQTRSGTSTSSARCRTE